MLLLPETRGGEEATPSVLFTPLALHNYAGFQEKSPEKCHLRLSPPKNYKLEADDN